MKTYFWKYSTSDKRGYNRNISVYEQNKDKSFSFIGSKDVSTASYKGDYATACEVLSKNKGHKLDKGNNWQGAGYSLASKNIKLIELP